LLEGEERRGEETRGERGQRREKIVFMTVLGLFRRYHKTKIE